MLVEQISLGVVIVLADVFGLFEGHHAGDGPGVGKVFVVALTRALNEHHRFGFLAVGGPGNSTGSRYFFKLLVGHHIGNLPVAQMSQFPFLRLVGTPAGRQNDCTIFFTIRIKGQNVLFAFIVLHKFFMQLLGIQFLALLVQCHFFRERIGYVKLDFFTGLFQGNGKVPRFTGDSRHNRFGFDGHIRIAFELINFIFDTGRNQPIIGIGAGQLFAPIIGFTAKSRLFFDQSDVIAGLGRFNRGRDAADAAADDQYGFIIRLELIGFRQIDFLHPGHAHFQIIFSQQLDMIDKFIVIFLLFSGCRKGRPGVRPDHLLAQVDSIHDTAVKPEHVIQHPA